MKESFSSDILPCRASISKQPPSRPFLCFIFPLFLCRYLLPHLVYKLKHSLGLKVPSTVHHTPKCTSPFSSPRPSSSPPRPWPPPSPLLINLVRSTKTNYSESSNANRAHRPTATSLHRRRVAQAIHVPWPVAPAPSNAHRTMATYAATTPSRAIPAVLTFLAVSLSSSLIDVSPRQID
jgi:hypothetical protein